jgi:ubiquinone/menaquinone biosynthesis C-methylase UbiE
MDNNRDDVVIKFNDGTGLFSSFILDKYPNARLTLIDLSDGMLEIAKARFQQYPKVTYVVSDYTKFAQVRNPRCLSIDQKRVLLKIQKMVE